MTRLVGVPPTSGTLWRRCSGRPLPQISATEAGRGTDDKTEAGASLARWVLGGCVGQRCDGELVCVPIDDEFKSADVAAIDLVRLWLIPIVTNVGLACRTFPWHREESYTANR